LPIQEVVWKVKKSVMEQAKSVNQTQTPAIYDQSHSTRQNLHI